MFTAGSPDTYSRCRSTGSRTCPCLQPDRRIHIPNLDISVKFWRFVHFSATSSFCFFLIPLVCIGCAQRNEEEPGGLVVLGSAEHDLGRHHQEEVLTHEFTLVNKLPTAVKIVDIQTSCGCLVVHKIEDAIPPGKSVLLPLRFATGAAQETASGDIVVSYRKVSNSADSGKPEYVRLRVRADIIPDYRITPREIDLGEIDGLTCSQLSRIVRVVPEAAVDVKLQEAKSLSAFLHAQILPKETHGAESQVKVSLDFSGFTESREINGSFVLSTDSKRVPKALVYVRGKYKSPAQIVPNVIVIGSDEQGEVARELRITTSQPARVHKAWCSGDKCARVQFNNELVATEHVVHLFIAPRQEKSFDGELQVEMQLFLDGWEKTVRTLRVPIHRFSPKGVENE